MGLRALLEPHLRSCSQPSIIGNPVLSTRPRARRVFHPGEQVHILLGHLGVPRRHPDFDALAVLGHILGGGPGFTDRLNPILRDELGLAHSIGGGMTDSAGLASRLFLLCVGTGPVGQCLLARGCVGRRSADS